MSQGRQINAPVSLQINSVVFSPFFFLTLISFFASVHETAEGVGVIFITPALFNETSRQWRGFQGPSDVTEGNNLPQVQALRSQHRHLWTTAFTSSSLRPSGENFRRFSYRKKLHIVLTLFFVRFRP